MYGLIGKKLKMSQMFNENGHVVPVTLIQAGPCTVSQVKTIDSDGYSSVQLAFGEKSKRNTNKPLKGHLKKAKIDSAKVLAEFQSVDGFDYKLGQKFDSSIFKIGDIMKISLYADKQNNPNNTIIDNNYRKVRSKPKGKGFAGVIKRHGFSKHPATHGTKHTLRAGGSIGQASSPSRVFKGLKMPGRLGNSYTTSENLEIVNIDKERNLLYVKGSIAGANNAIVFILKK